MYYSIYIYNILNKIIKYIKCLLMNSVAMILHILNLKSSKCTHFPSHWILEKIAIIKLFLHIYVFNPKRAQT